MPEAGGPTTQSGILFQNSIAALYLGRLIDSRLREQREQVTHVRVEDRSHVDDIVVTFADDHRDWIHAKESLPTSRPEFKRLWRNVFEQRRAATFQSGDRIRLVVGDGREFWRSLTELALRASGARDDSDWRASWSKGGQRVVGQVRKAIEPDRLDDAALFALFQNLEVEIVSLRQIERDLVPVWMPDAAGPATATRIYEVLLSWVGGNARRRREVGPADALQKLGAHEIELAGARRRWSPLDRVVAHHLRDAVTLARFAFTDFIIKRTGTGERRLNTILHAHMTPAGARPPVERRLIEPIAALLATPGVGSVYDGIDGASNEPWLSVIARGIVQAALLCGQTLNRYGSRGPEVLIVEIANFSSSLERAHHSLTTRPAHMAAPTGRHDLADLLLALVKADRVWIEYLSG